MISIWTKKLIFFYDKARYQLFSVTSLEEAHWQGKVFINLDDDTESHIKLGETLNIFCASLQGLSVPLTT